MTATEAMRQRMEALADHWRQHPDRIPPAEACEQLLAALDGPQPVELPGEPERQDHGLPEDWIDSDWSHYR